MCLVVMMIVIIDWIYLIQSLDLLQCDTGYTAVDHQHMQRQFNYVKYQSGVVDLYRTLRIPFHYDLSH